MKKAKHGGILRLIAFFRFAKALLLIISGLGALHLMHPGVVSRVGDWLSAMPFAAQHAFVRRGIAKLTDLSPKRIEELAIVAFLYAALFITEATGLWLEQIWAEWLTVIATTTFIPFEAYEVVKKATVLRIAILLANVAVVIYLIYRRRTYKGA